LKCSYIRILISHKDLKKRIAVNTRMLLPGKMEGIGNYTFETMRRLTVQHPDAEFIFIFDRPFDSSFLFSENIIPVVAFPPARHPILWYLWHEWSLPKIFKKYKPDVFISMDGYQSLSTKTPSLAVIHDLNFEHFPGDLPPFNRIYYRHYFPKFTTHAKKIAAVSQFTKDDLIKCYNIDSSKIDVIYNGVNEKFIPVNDQIKSLTRNKFAKGNPYFLFVGALHQRKNIANLLRAFDEFKKSTSSNFQLVLTGQKRWWTKEMEDVLKTIASNKDVIFTGRVSDEDRRTVVGAGRPGRRLRSGQRHGLARRCAGPERTAHDRVRRIDENAGRRRLHQSEVEHQTSDPLSKWRDRVRAGFREEDPVANEAARNPQIMHAAAPS